MVYPHTQGDRRRYYREIRQSQPQPADPNGPSANLNLPELLNLYHVLFYLPQLSEDLAESRSDEARRD